MIKKNYIIKKCYDAIQILEPKYLKYSKGQITAKLHYCKFYIDSDQESGSFHIWYEGDITVNHRSDFDDFMEKVDSDHGPIGIISYEETPVQFSMGQYVYIDEDTDLEWLKNHIFQFSKVLNENIDLAYAHHVPITCHI